MSRVFKNVLCVATLLLAQSGAFGMEKTVDPAHEIGENVTITERSQLLSITPEQAKRIKSLRIENQMIDSDFHDFFLSVRELNCLYFDKCIVDCVTLFDVEQVPVLGIVNCNLTSDLAKEVLEDITNWDYIETLDLSHNRLGTNPEKFFTWIKRSVIGTVTVYNLVLSCNGFAEESKSGVVSYFNQYYPCWRVII